MQSAAESNEPAVASQIALEPDVHSHIETWTPRYAARLEPFTSTKTKPRLSWLTLPLAATWAIHMSCLGPLLLREPALLPTLTVESRSVHGLAFLSCVLIVLIEVVLRLLGKLRPAVILTTQICKALAWTLAFLSILFVADSTGDGKGAAAVVVARLFVTVAMLTTYGMLIYTCVDNRREWRRFRRDHPSEFDCPDTEGRPQRKQRGSLLVNQSTSLQHSSPIILQMVNWIQIEVIRAQETKGIFRSALAWMSVVVRYLAVSTLSSFFLVISKRLPGEPKTDYWKVYVQQYVDAVDHEPAQFSDQKYQEVVLPQNAPRSRLRIRDEGSTDYHGLRASPSATSLRTIETESSAVSSTACRSVSQPRHHLVPRILCFLTTQDGSGSNDDPYQTRDVEQWRSQHGIDIDISYIFISYTRKQFLTHIPSDPTINSAMADPERQEVARDKKRLTDYGVQAAKQAGVAAFWIDFECIQPEEDESEADSIQDVYNICDIVRKAHSLSIVVGPPRDRLPGEADNTITPSEKTAWLRQWGSRLWTVPEALLSPSQHGITIYFAGGNGIETIAKRNFAARAYDQGDAMQRLLEHYENALALGPLVLISLALQCLLNRQTEKRMDGDVAYALMGLLHCRPEVRKSDSAFQAFARLSLANDSNKLLMRILCLNPKRASAPWHDLSDTWDAQLWDIDPIGAVAKVDDAQSVTLGDMKGSVINWSHLELVDIVTASTSRGRAWYYLRLMAKTALMAHMLVLLVWGVIYLELLKQLFGGSTDHDVPSGLQARNEEPLTDDNKSSEAGWSLLSELAAFLISPCIPGVLMWLQKGEILSSQARFFGCEGIPNLDLVEQRVFGSSHRNLDFCREEYVPQRGADQRLFTLIDTYSRKAIVFWANEPPEVVMVCGHDRGLLRALLCSYDWDKKTLYRQATVRLEAMALERMHTMDRVKFRVQQ